MHGGKGLTGRRSFYILQITYERKKISKNFVVEAHLLMPLTQKKS